MPEQKMQDSSILRYEKVKYRKHKMMFAALAKPLALSLGEPSFQQSAKLKFEPQPKKTPAPYGADLVLLVTMIWFGGQVQMLQKNAVNNIADTSVFTFGNTG